MAPYFEVTIGVNLTQFSSLRCPALILVASSRLLIGFAGYLLISTVTLHLQVCIIGPQLNIQQLIVSLVTKSLSLTSSLVDVLRIRGEPESDKIFNLLIDNTST